MKRLANKLKKIFPDHQYIEVRKVRLKLGKLWSVPRNDCGKHIIWTSFPMDVADDRVIFDEHRMGYEDVCHPKLQQFMDDNNLRYELHNSESLTIYKS